jgi:biopolymer transport protein ExbD
MMDIFIVILLFLLKSYSATEEIISSSEAFQLPASESIIEPQPALTIKVNNEVILLDNIKVAKTQEVLESTHLDILPLYEQLKKHAKLNKFIAVQRKSGPFQGSIIIQGDRDISFLLLKKIMYTCSRAEYGNIALAVIQKQS